jgi:hypothetical protein
MLHKMSEIRGWSHDEMMEMNKSLFYRYYGYWYQDSLREQDEYDKKDRESRNKEKPVHWKKL